VRVTLGPAMNVYLIRHAHAGARGDGPRDVYRPLSPKGHQRAADLAAMLAGTAVTRIVSSPATRCTQTVEPLARRLGLEVDEHPDLWEGSELGDVLAVLCGHQGGDLVACSHGDVIPDVLDHLAAAGVDLQGRGCEKGSLWVLERYDGEWVRGRYVGRSVTGL
jgi:broad specificity phosphatase PhoE